VEYIETDWQTARQMLAEGEANVGAVCGLLYAQMRAQGVFLRPIVAPVLNHPRYNEPVYWADVVVRRDSKAKTLSDLRGRHWLLNEEGSYSGYISLLAELARRDSGADFLGTKTATGSHKESLDQLLSGQGDYTVLDSTFLDFQPTGVQEQVKVVDSLGPAPVPLLVGFGEAAQLFRQACQDLAELPSVFSKLVPVTDQDYQPIRLDWNSGTVVTGSHNQGFLTETSIHPSFASTEQQAYDQAILAKIGREMLSLRDKPAGSTLPDGTRVHKLVEQELEHHHYLIDTPGLEDSNLSLVGFLSQMRADVNLKALFDADDLILQQISSYKGFLTYSPTEYAPGKWANLAVFTNTGCRDRWALDSEHMKAIRELSASSYENVRLHLGVWPSIDSPMNWIATRYLDYTQSNIWRAVRTQPAG
jgi:hypothetical protein